jgi:hypothetical protein
MLDRKIAAGPGRKLEAGVIPDLNEHPQLSQELRGTIPRGFMSRFQVPPDTAALQELNGRLGKFYELAMVYTWIAGLLNILAIWDAVEGPAYGYGDEEPPEDEAEAAKTTARDQPADKAAAAAVDDGLPSKTPSAAT